MSDCSCTNLVELKTFVTKSLGMFQNDIKSTNNTKNKFKNLMNSQTKI